MIQNNDPREPREFTDMSDYPQNGFGLMDADREDRIPADDEQIEEPDDNDGHFEGYDI